MSQEFLLATADTNTLGHGTQAPVNTSTEVGQTTTPAPAGGLFGGDSFTLILMYVALFAVAWLFILRPQRKRQKAQQAMQAALQVGDSIMTNSGLYGKIVDMGSDVYVVEFGTNKGIRIPVAKSEILAKKEPNLS